MWPNSQFPADLVIFIEEPLLENFIFCAVVVPIFYSQLKYYTNYFHHLQYVTTANHFLLPTIFDRDLYNKYFLNYCFSNYTLLNIREFSKSRAMRAIRPRGVYESMCSRANVPKACQLLIFTYQVLPCQRANKRTNVPTCQPKACQLFNLACQRANRRANFWNWHANLPAGESILQLRLTKGVPVFQLFFKRKCFSIIEFFKYA